MQIWKLENEKHVFTSLLKKENIIDALRDDMT